MCTVRYTMIIKNKKVFDKKKLVAHNFQHETKVTVFFIINFYF